MENPSITCKYILTRIDRKSKKKTYLLQSNDWEELQLLKGRLESDLPLDIFNSNLYLTEENVNFSMS